MTQQLLIWLERDENGFLHSVRPFPELSAPRILATADAEEEIEYDDSEPTPQEVTAMSAAAFADWADPAEDIYSMEDGKPYNSDEK
jgi:hypothetical protein